MFLLVSYLLFDFRLCFILTSFIHTVILEFLDFILYIYTNNPENIVILYCNKYVLNINPIGTVSYFYQHCDVIFIVHMLLEKRHRKTRKNEKTSFWVPHLPLLMVEVFLLYHHWVLHTTYILNPSDLK